MNFSTLSPSDFEFLAADLLSTALDVRFERFGEGRDGGIDCQYQHHSPQGKERWVGQAKRYADTQRLIRQMSVEKQKMKKLDTPPKRYFLVTSCSLLPDHKESIVNIMSPYIQSSGDIFGADDIKALLEQNPTLYARHHRLWLHSIEQLNRQLHAASYTRSKIALQLALDSAKQCIEHPQLASIQQCLDTNQACLIVGDPGSGKTTTVADLGLRYFLMEEPNLELNWFTDRSFDEALNLIRQDTQQLFIFDDCFGATFLSDDLAIKQRQNWITLLRLAQASEGKLRLLFTTRDYILKQALHQMGQDDQSIKTLVNNAVRIDSNNAQFRINFTLHALTHSGLSGSALQKIINEQLYWPIIIDLRFSPRMIKLLFSQLHTVDQSEFESFIKNSLVNPDNLWREAYDRLSNAAQTLVLLIGLSHDYSDAAELLNGFFQLYQLQHGRQATSTQFDMALLEAEPIFIKTRSEHGSVWLSVANPGVQDFVYKELNANQPLVNSIIESLPIFNWGIESFSITPDSQKPIRLQPTQIKSLLEKLLQLADQPGSILMQSAETGQWIKQTQSLGSRLSLLWQNILHDEELAQWLYTQLTPLLPVGKNWKSILVESDLATLLNLSRYADNTTQVDLWTAAQDNLLNSEDAAALAEFYIEYPSIRKILGKKRSVERKLLSACINEIATVNDSYHLDAIMYDLYRIEEAMGTNIDEPKYMIYRMIDPYEDTGMDYDDSDLDSIIYYTKPDPFENHTQLHGELERLRQYTDSKANELIL